MRNYTEIISWSKRRRHLTTATETSRWRTGPALCSPYTYGATADDAKKLDRFHEMDFKAVPLCKTCARVAEGDAEYDAKTAGNSVVNNAVGDIVTTPANTTTSMTGPGWSAWLAAIDAATLAYTISQRLTTLNELPVEARHAHARGTLTRCRELATQAGQIATSLYADDYHQQMQAARADLAMWRDGEQ